MLIAIDYDGTYTVDPDLWNRFIQDAQNSGHTVICATMRHEYESNSISLELKSMVEIIFTGRKAKSVFLESLDIKPDIWIDDKPSWLFQDSF